MSENTKIQWADNTFNPWEGCTKVSPGCLHCYADTRAQRFGQVKWGKGQPRRRTSAANWKLPVKWNREAAQAERDHDADMIEYADRTESWTRPRVFCASLADWLDDEVPIEWLADLLKLIHDTPNLDWLLLTKRPENFNKRVEQVWLGATPMTPFSYWLSLWIGSMNPVERQEPPANVWLGASVEDQARADERIPKLLSIPAKVRFLSCEPLLGPVDLEPWLKVQRDYATTADFNGIDWCIIGGESGPNARPCNVDWIRSLVSQCRAAGVAPFVKQLGANIKERITEGGQVHGILMHDKKGGDPAEWPDDLRVREFPTPNSDSELKGMGEK